MALIDENGVVSYANRAMKSLLEAQDDNDAGYGGGVQQMLKTTELRKLNPYKDQEEDVKTTAWKFLHDDNAQKSGVNFVMKLQQNQDMTSRELLKDDRIETNKDGSYDKHINMKKVELDVSGNVSKLLVVRDINA